MPIRWIVFRLFNYLVMLSVTIQSIVILSRIELSRSGDWIFNTIFLFCVGILITNSIFNIILLERYYPAQIPSHIFKRTSMNFFILAILVMALYVLILSILIFELLFGESLVRRFDWPTILNFLLLGCTAIGGIYTLINRNFLTRLIKHNHQLQFNNFLETSN